MGRSGEQVAAFVDPGRELAVADPSAAAYSRTAHDLRSSTRRAGDVPAGQAPLRETPARFSVDAGHAELAPGGVADALAVAVGAGRRDEVPLEGLEVDLVLGRGHLDLEVETLLHELEPLQRIGLGQFVVDAVEPLPHGIDGALAAPLGTMRLERFEVATNGASLRPALGQSRLVVIGEPG